MEILNSLNITQGVAEFVMQEQVDKFLQSHDFKKWNPTGGPYGLGEYEKVHTICLREVRIPEVGRISDNVLLINKRRVVNIECKLSDYGGVIRQAEDHLRWCDYSVICLPADGVYMANYYKTELITKGIGLWYWFRDIGIFEFILPKFNRKKNLEIRKEVINRIIAKNNEGKQGTLFEEV